MGYDTSEYMPISDNIMVLRDKLSADIIRLNLESQMNKNIIMSYEPVNYLVDILERRAALEDELNPHGTIDEKDFMDNMVLDLFKLTEKNLEEKFGVELGEDLDYLSQQDYLDKIEIMYEFFFIRYYENLVLFIFNEILTRKNDYYKLFKDEVDLASKANTGDVYVRYSKEKYKDTNMITVLYKLKDIVDIIRFSEYDMLDVVDKIISLDPYEECNFNIDKMFIRNYGKDAGFKNESQAYSHFMNALFDDVVLDRLLNDVKLKLMETFQRVD